jgi:uncharacterized protein (DUF2236 family)
MVSEELREVEGLFGPDSVTWRVHSDPAMIVGGLRALLLQATHPLVMSGFTANTDYRSDPWGRYRRTGEFVGAVAFGTVAEAEAAGASVRAIHARLRPAVDERTGRTYRVDDPDLLLWVHCAEVDSFLSAYLRSGGPLSVQDADRYVDEMRQSARLVGLDPATVPASTAELAQYVQAMRPHLRVTPDAAEGALWGMAPPMSWRVSLLTPARPAWAGLVALAWALLPRWARRLYGLPGLPTTDLAATAAARGLRRTLLLAPGGLGRNPAYAAALARLAAYHSHPGRTEPTS